MRQAAVAALNPGLAGTLVVVVEPGVIVDDEVVVGFTVVVGFSVVVGLTVVDVDVGRALDEVVELVEVVVGGRVDVVDVDEVLVVDVLDVVVDVLGMSVVVVVGTGSGRFVQVAMQPANAA